MTEMTNKGESRFNHGLEWANVLFVTMTDIATSYNLRMHQKRNKKCNKNRDPHLFACVNKFLASESLCEIPWLKKYSPPGLKKCTNEEIMQYFEFAYNVSSGYGSKIDRKGCAGGEKYCVENFWKAEKFSTEKQSASGNLFGYFTILSQEVVCTLFNLCTLCCIWKIELHPSFTPYLKKFFFFNLSIKLNS